MLAYSGQVMTVANSIIGVGILAMPFCFQKCGIGLAVLLLIVSNWVTRICCHYLIKSSLLTRRKSIEFLGFHAFGASGKLLAELCTIGYLFGTCIMYFVVVGDLGPQIVTKMLTLNVEGYPHLRVWIMIAVTLFCILPLGMLKNVDSLATVCAATIGFYVCLVIKIVLESEEHIVANDWSEKVVYWRPAGILQCLPIFSMALSCQMQMFEVFKSINNQSIEKLNGVVRNATWICTLVYIAVGFFGYVAFCTQSFSGNILMNFSPSFGSDVIKIGFVLSVAFSFPLVIFPCRASIYSLLYRKGHSDNTGYIPETRFKVITICIVGLALCIALIIPSIELIIGLVGSTIGVAICIMFPASCFRKIVKKESTERSLAQYIFIGGFCLMVLGTYANLNAIDERRSGAHLETLKTVENVVAMIPTETLRVVEQNDVLQAAKESRLAKAELKFENSNPEAKNNEAILIQKMENVGNAIKSPSASSPPPMPVDEKHVDVENVKDEVVADKNTIDKLSVVSPKPDESKIEESNTRLDNKEPPKLPPAVEEKKNGSSYSDAASKDDKIIIPLPLQTINKDAIKKDEEIAAEELKLSQKQPKVDNVKELKETQKELKKTKELLERTVDQLKEELAKQNKETQNLVAEKLDAVVQKVEQIERKVQQQEPQLEKEQSQVQLQQELLQQQKHEELRPHVQRHQESQPQSQPQMQQQQPPPQGIEQKSAQRQEAELKAPQQIPRVQKLPKLQENQTQPQEPQSKEIAPSGAKPEAVNSQFPAELRTNLLLNIVSEKLANGDAPMAPGKVYEPLSYKTGELIEHAKHGGKLEQRFPLPLARLLNASNVNKINDSVKVRTREGQEPKLDKMPPKEIFEKIAQNPEKAIPTAAKVPGNVADEQDKHKENVESIRRDILELNNEQLKELTSLAPSAEGAHQRLKRSNKRSASEFEVINAKLQEENCLTAPKIEQLMAHGISNAISLKMQNIAREETR